MNAVLPMDNDNTFGIASRSDVTLPISSRPECEGQATKPKLYFYSNFRNMQTPTNSCSNVTLNDVSKPPTSTPINGFRSLGVNSAVAVNSFNISAITDPSCLNSSHQPNLVLNNNNANRSVSGVDGGLETTSDPRLCPRVLVDVNLPVGSKCLRPTSGLNNYLTSHNSPAMHLDLGIITEDKNDNNRRIKRDKKWIDIKQQQLDAYKAWVNSQLRKRPESRPIDDLRSDIRDGRVLADLIDIVGNNKLQGIYLIPGSRQEMLHTVDAVLQFVQKNKIRMHEMTAADIVDGNLKCIMRLILALAAHYKPSSVKHSSYHHIKSPSKSSTANVTGIAQAAAVALSEARRNAARAGHRHRRNRDSAISEKRYGGHRYQDSSSEQFSDSDQSQTGSQYRHQLDSSRCSNRLSPRCHNSRINDGSYLDSLPRSKSLSIDHIHAKDSGAELEDAASVVDKSQYDDLLQDYTQLVNNLHKTKTELVILQELLLREEEPGESEAATTKLIRQLHSKDKYITSLKHDIVKLQDEITQQIHEKEKITQALKSEICDLHDQMQIVGATGASLSARVASQDKRMARLEGKIFQANPEDGSHSIKPQYQNSASELHVVRDSLQSLRHHFESTSPHNHTIDTLEQSIALLIEKLHTTESSSFSHTLSSSRSLLECSPKKLNYDSAPERRTISTITPSGFRRNKSSNSPQTSSSQHHPVPPSTNILYFTDTSVTPKMSKISKQLGEITLGDFKKLFDRPSMYRYHFKALDPEYGTVKEEVLNDDDIVPGWEGKIVAWVEADLQTEC